jgi:MFS family permease
VNKQNKNFGNNIKLIGLCMASFIGCIDFTIVNTALPAIQQAFHTNIMQTQWAITAFIIALCGFMVLMGNLADKYGPTKILYVGYLNFLIASILAREFKYEVQFDE